jgi:WD40 repeat protein
VLGVVGGLVVLFLVVGVPLLWLLNDQPPGYVEFNEPRRAAPRPAPQPIQIPNVQPVVPPPAIKPPTPVPLVLAPDRLGRLNHVRDLAYAPGGRLLATVQAANDQPDRFVVQVWDTTTGKQLSKPHDGAEDVGHPVFSADGRRLSCHFFRRTSVKVWDTNTGKLLHSFVAPAPEVFDERLLGFAPDGRLLLACSDRNLYRLSAADGSVKSMPLTFEFQPEDRLACSPREPLLVVANGTALLRFELAAGAQKGFLPFAYEATHMTFSDDGRALAVATPDGPVRMFDAAAWQDRSPVQRDDGEGRAYYSFVQLSADGRRLLGLPVFGNAREQDLRGRIEIWDVETHDVHKLDVEGFHKAALAPDGRTVAVAVSGGRLLFLDATTGRERPAVAADERP